MKKFSVLFLISCFLVVISACSGDMKKDSAIGLKISKDSLISVAATAKRLCEQGVLSDRECRDAEIYYTEGRKVLLEAKATWDEMVDNDSMDNSVFYNSLINRVTDIMGRIENIIKERK